MSAIFSPASGGHRLRLKAVLQESDAESSSFSRGTAQQLDRRRSGRRVLKLAAVTSSPAAGEIAILIRDISPTGMLVEVDSEAPSVGDRIEFALPDCGFAAGRLVWKSGRYFGCQFDSAISGGAISAALLKADPETATSGTADSLDRLVSASGERFGPAINLSGAFLISLLLWSLIGAVVYFVTR